MPLSREEILAKRRPPKPVNVPLWGGEVYLKYLSGVEFAAWEAWLQDQKEKADTVSPYARANLVVRCVCDESGARLFTDDDAKALGEAEGGGAVLDYLWDLCAPMNGIGRAATEEIAKN